MPLYSFEDKTPNLTAPEKSWIAPNATIIGNVTLEEQTSVWFGAVIRGDNDHIHIQQGTNIQESVVMHTDPGIALIIEPYCTIGHQAMLHGCIIKRNCLIGMGATLLNGSVIGENSLVGAHALVPENKTFPSGVLILGSPAKVVRDLTKEEIERLTKSAQGYISKIERYRKGLELIGQGL